jgi:uncharacterized integral membrane protein (TIGR00698 family)
LTTPDPGADPNPSPGPRRSFALHQGLPGLLLASAIAAAAFGLKALSLPGISRISPLMLAILLGMLVRNLLGRPEIARAGIALCLRAPLRTGIVLLGLQVTLAEILGIGFAGLAILTFALLGTFFFTLWLGERLGVRSGLTMLIATGTGICGASAIVAANTVVRDTEEAVAYALATVTLFGTIAMFSYPVLGGMLPLDARAYGLWTGASVHEVAQVVAAGFARGQATGEFATVAKLARVLMLAPLVIGMGLWMQRRLAKDAAPGSTAVLGKVPMPWFVFGFLAMVLLAGTGWIPTELRASANTLAQLLLALALAAVGLETDVRKLIAQGWQPLALGAAATAFIASSTLALALLWQP